MTTGDRPARREFFATCTLGLEAVVAGELRAIGASDVEPRRGGVGFFGDLALGWRSNLELRSATRVQEKILAAHVRAEKQLYGAVQRIEWDRFLALDQTLAVEATVRDSFLTHSGYAALLVKDAIVDAFREKHRRRPNVDPKAPHLPLNLMLKNDTAVLYRNLSGESLHKRGYRPIQVKSPLNEATAAGLLLLSGWDWKTSIVDPMCGSATFLIEAAMLALGRAPGLARRFAFERWPDFDRAAFERIKTQVKSRERDVPGLRFEGADSHAGALSLAEKAVKAAHLSDRIKLVEKNAADYEPAVEFGAVFVNPPWGERLGPEDDVDASWRELGRFLHQRCTGKSAWVLSGDATLPKFLGLKASRRFPVRIGTIDCRLLRYDVF